MKFFLLVIFLVGAGALFGPKPETKTVPPVTKQVRKVEPQPVAADEVAQLLILTNNQRLAHNLGALALKQTLNISAEKKCADMQARNYWAHSINGEAWQKDFTDVGYLGENLAKQFTPEQAVGAWMASPTHRDNILKLQHTRVGFGICDGPVGHLIVQHFSGV